MPSLFQYAYERFLHHKKNGCDEEKAVGYAAQEFADAVEDFHKRKDLPR